MKSYRSYGDGSYLKKEDVTPVQLWTISDVQERKVTVPGGKPKDKLVLLFKDVQKGLVLNMSQGDVLYEMTGSDDPEEWIGVQVELFIDETVLYAGKRVGGIRLRKPNNEPF